MANREKDMYGHLIHLGNSGFGVSLTWFTTSPGNERKRPYMTVFHESDGFQQSLFSVVVDASERPAVSDVFDDRLREVLDLVNQGHGGGR